MAQPIPPNGEQQPTRNNDMVEQFRRMGLPRLRGLEGPMGLEEWIREIERIF